MRGSGIEQNGRANRANKHLPSTNSENWNASTLTPGSKQPLRTLLGICHHHVVDSSCTTALEANDTFLGRRLSHMSWCRARYLLNWGGRAGKRTNNKTYSRGMRKPKAEYPPRLTQKVSKARFYWNPQTRGHLNPR